MENQAFFDLCVHRSPILGEGGCSKIPQGGQILHLCKRSDVWLKAASPSREESVALAFSIGLELLTIREFN
ncbi:hypothetical protein CDG76_09995 [Nostoc sp. 'Peltigera membranacea cyanobiont' 210A]|nr:hypothetical protein CDG76_09995 [Nostoc sp. 'Peltigera membranacea cyanobiont' 210A]